MSSTFLIWLLMMIGLGNDSLFAHLFLLPNLIPAWPLHVESTKCDSIALHVLGLQHFWLHCYADNFP